MPEYRVTWVIDLDADDAAAAATKARVIQLNPESTATVFDVEHRASMIDRQPTAHIDLDELVSDDTYRDTQVQTITEAIQQCAEDSMDAGQWADGLFDCGVRFVGPAAVQETSP